MTVDDMVKLIDTIPQSERRSTVKITQFVMEVVNAGKAATLTIEEFTLATHILSNVIDCINANVSKHDTVAHLVQLIVDEKKNIEKLQHSN